jgi:hypothetical protein
MEFAAKFTGLNSFFRRHPNMLLQPFATPRIIARSGHSVAVTPIGAALFRAIASC